MEEAYVIRNLDSLDYYNATKLTPWELWIKKSTIFSTKKEAVNAIIDNKLYNTEVVKVYIKRR